MSLLSLGAISGLLDGSFSGFAHPPSKTLLPLLENEAGTTGNVVVQQASLGLRQASLSFIARSSAEKDLARGYDETGETVVFVDYDGTERSVMVLDYSAALRFGDVWNVSVTMLELSEPLAPGS